MNFDDASSASAPHPQAKERLAVGEGFYFTFGMTATAPESCLKAKKLSSSIIMQKERRKPVLI